MKNEKPDRGKSSETEATPEQKKKFEKKKLKQMDKSQPQSEPDSDEDTTGKIEVFKKRNGSRQKRLIIHKSGIKFLIVT